MPLHYTFSPLHKLTFSMYVQVNEEDLINNPLWILKTISSLILINTL